MNWISAEDRLPPKNGIYLVCLDKKYVLLASFSAPEWFKIGNYFSYSEITHWMPLPEPPGDRA